MDADVGRWILEFLLRQPLDDRLLNSLINILPLPNDNNSGLKKALLLRKIESEIANNSVTENILDFLQQIEELDFQNGIHDQSNAIKAAYCAVAVACTVKFLKHNGDDGKFKYFDTVKRIWRGRVCKLEAAEEVGLVSDELRSWKDEIEAAVWEESACDNVLKRSEGMDAVEVIRAYVQNEKVKMGPSFLELVAEAVRVDDKLRELLGNRGQAGGKEAGLTCADQNKDQSNGYREVQKENVHPRRKHIAFKSSRGARHGTSRGVKISDIGSSEADLLEKKHDLPPTPEVNRVQEALASSSLELQAVVKDPLPDALHLAETILGSMARKNTGNEPVEENHVRVNHPVDERSRAAQDLSNSCCGRQKSAPKPSLMARNSTACTFEWDDSIDDLPEDSGNDTSRLQLPSPKRRVISPLKKYEFNKVMKRRQIKRWSTLEEDTLRAGVQKYGIGNWKLILNAYRDVFEERTEVDLKDKWRNLTRY